MHHHGGMNAPESAALKKQNLAAAVAHFLGGRANDADGEAYLVGHYGRSKRRAHRRGRDDVVAAGMADAGQAIVLMFSGTDPKRARKAVGRSQMPFSTAKPASASTSHSQAEDRSSSKPSSGCAWMRWLSSIRPSRDSSKRSRAASFASISSFPLLFEAYYILIREEDFQRESTSLSRGRRR